MPAIKITLPRLIELFGKSVNTVELPAPVRALAARLMTLTAHVVRIDQKIDDRVKELSEQITTLTDIVQTLAQAQTTTADRTATPAAASVASPEASSVEQGEEEVSEDDEFAARVRAESEAEVAAINGSAPETEPMPTVTPLPRGKKAGGAK